MVQKLQNIVHATFFVPFERYFALSPTLSRVVFSHAAAHSQNGGDGGNHGRSHILKQRYQNILCLFFHDDVVFKC